MGSPETPQSFQVWIRQHFQFLLDWGFDLRVPFDETHNLYGLTFVREDLDIQVEGIHWGMGASMSLCLKGVADCWFFWPLVRAGMGLPPDPMDHLGQREQVARFAQDLQEHLEVVLLLPRTFWQGILQQMDLRLLNMTDPEPEAFRALCREVLRPLLDRMQATECTPEHVPDDLELALMLQGEEVLPLVDFQARNDPWQLELESSWGRLTVYLRDLGTTRAWNLMKWAQEKDPTLEWEDAAHLPRLEWYRIWLGRALPVLMTYPDLDFTL